MNYKDDLNQCNKLYRKHVSFAMFARDKMPEYIKRCEALEKGMAEIKRIIDEL
jgi:hypothetical protein